MQEAEVNYVERELDLQAFHDALETLPGPLFAVLDGAHFDDVEDELGDLGIDSRSLFLRGGNEDMRRDGPWLVDLSDERKRAHIEKMAMAMPCAVFWSCSGGGDVLWKHLRTINQILVPDDRIAGNRGEIDSPIIYERVLFRHWDPNVIGSFIAKFNPQQLAAFFGPAQAILLNTMTYGGLKRAIRPRNLPQPERGPLRLDPHTIKAIENAQHDHQVRRISQYLRSAAPDHTQSMTDADLHIMAKRYSDEARSYGILSEAGAGRWSYMQIVSGGQFGAMPEVRVVMAAKAGPFSPDERIRHLMTVISMKLREAC